MSANDAAAYWDFIDEWRMWAQAHYNAPERARSMDYDRYQELRHNGTLNGRP